MAYQAAFKRCKIKYLPTAQQKMVILQAIRPYMKHDRYGRTMIQNTKFDTGGLWLTRQSLCRPDCQQMMTASEMNNTRGAYHVC